MKRLLFLVFTALLSLLFVVAFWQDSNREWTRYQRQFLGHLRKDERRGLTGGIKQVIVSDLKRIDRCTTCHMAIDQPQLALAEEPFTVHPGDYLKWHPPEQFGCTVCHGGQGLATDVKGAHGEVEHWERPLLRGALVQSSCAKCHGDIQTIESHVPKLAQGIDLFKKNGCVGCHTVHGFGQTVSVDLSDVADKSWQLIDFTFVKGRQSQAAWLAQHFVEPRKITPGFRKEELPAGEEEVYPTFMPNYGFSDEQAEALTVYMLSLTAESLPAKYVIADKSTETPPVYATAVERGRAAFQKYGCIGCHGQEAMGGRRNYNAQLGQEIPSLVYVKAYYGRDSLKDVIRNGRQPVPRADGSRPRPPAYMPAWKDRIPDAEIDDIIEYLLSLYDQIPQPKQVSQEKP